MSSSQDTDKCFLPCVRTRVCSHAYVLRLPSCTQLDLRTELAVLQLHCMKADRDGALKESKRLQEAASKVKRGLGSPVAKVCCVLLSTSFRG